MRSIVLALLTVALLPLSAEAAPRYAPGMRSTQVLRPCTTPTLRASLVSEEGATLHRELTIALTNTGERGCAIDGYPAVRLLDAAKNVQISAESFASAPRFFVLNPGAKALFGLRVATGDGTAQYRTVPLLAIVPPGDVAPLYLTLTLPAAPMIEVTPLAPDTKGTGG
ncbi:MAG: DUF4232 domain-containing protein [Candidatus Eremiobacteraeota bacterium]|nr:DUF4232 domain-containing protein [Candidatus Eremiobacteraeota bacterium]